MADDNDNPDDVISRIVGTVRKDPHVLSIGDERALARAYDQIAVRLFLEEAPRLRDGPSFDQDIGDLTDWLKAKLTKRIYQDLECIFSAIRQWGGTVRAVPDAIKIRIGEALQAERIKLTSQRNTRDMPGPPGDLWAKEWVTVAEASQLLGKSLDHTRTLVRTKLTFEKLKSGRIRVSVRSIRNYLWP